MSVNILVIDADDSVRKLLSSSLLDMNYQVHSCQSGREGLEAAKAGSYDLVVLDIVLPDIDGLEICRQLRANRGSVPILIITAKNTEADRVVGLELGADDYLTKPVSVREFQARVRALLRRVELLACPVVENEKLIFDQLHIDVNKRDVFLAGKKTILTNTEFDLLLYMARNPGYVYSRSQLLSDVWGYCHNGYEHTVNSHINRLRNKLEKVPSNPSYVLTVWGFGYKFSDEYVN